MIVVIKFYCGVFEFWGGGGKEYFYLVLKVWLFKRENKNLVEEGWGEVKVSFNIFR